MDKIRSDNKGIADRDSMPLLMQIAKADNAKLDVFRLSGLHGS